MLIKFNNNKPAKASSKTNKYSIHKVSEKLIRLIKHLFDKILFPLSKTKKELGKNKLIFFESFLYSKSIRQKKPAFRQVFYNIS